MKHIVPFVAMVALFVMAGCSEKFKIAAPYKNITVVYGFLDAADTAHYIRIQKAFLDENKSALSMAQTSDSNFYSNINVVVKRFNFTGELVDVTSLTRVNLDSEGYPKEPGVFFTAPNYAYKFTNTLNSNYIYRLVVRNQATGKEDSAESPVINDIDPHSFIVDQFDPSIPEYIDFASTLPGKYFEITGQYTGSPDFSFHGYNSPVAVAQAYIRFNWNDSNTITHEQTAHSYDYNAGYYKISNGAIDFQIPDIQLYYALAVGMSTPPANTVRLLNRCTVFVYMSTQDFLSYQQSSLTQGVGITGSDIQPIATNIKGDDAIGLFTARGMRSGILTIGKNTVDSLIASSILQNARIVGTVYH